MPNSLYVMPMPQNEPVLGYAPGSSERDALILELDRQAAEVVDIPLIIGGKEVRTGDTATCVMPHEHGHVLATYHKAGPREAALAAEAALDAKADWESLSAEDRASFVLKVADMLAGPKRQALNAAAMLNLSKSAFQAEIDAACELIDFLRFNARFMSEIYADQPASGPGMLNRMEYRPLEGFVLAVTPFNFLSIAGNLAVAPALMGNTVVWKPASSAVLAAWRFMELLMEAGLPRGVINFLPGDGPVVGDALLVHPQLAGVHFTGSTATFQRMWRTVGENIGTYATYPRLVGETGGKDFIVAHGSADIDGLCTALVRGAYEFQGQKCSAASRAYIPESIWIEVEERVCQDLAGIEPGDPRDFSRFMNSLIHEAAFDKTMGYIDMARNADEAEILHGGRGDKSAGYFIEPTLIKVSEPDFVTMRKEIFGPVLSVYVYPDEEFEAVLRICDETSPYGLTGSIFATEREIIALAEERLRNAAGNFYINDKPTGAVVGQQPFGGSRASGTNDKAGSKLNLLRWTSARTIKETFIPPRDYRYPHMG